jgi:hypothetical protein
METNVVIKESRKLDLEVNDVKIRCFTWLENHQCAIKEKKTGKFVAEQTQWGQAGVHPLLAPKKISISYFEDYGYTNVELVIETLREWQAERDPSGYKWWWADIVVDFWYNLDVILTDEYLMELYPYENLVMRFNHRVDAFKLLSIFMLFTYSIYIFFWFKIIPIITLFYFLVLFVIYSSNAFIEVNLLMLKERLYPESMEEEIGLMRRIIYKIAFIQTIDIK